MQRETNIAALLFATMMIGASAMLAQDVLAPVAGEYRISGELGGNQVAPGLAFNNSGGYVVWQDDALDGDGTSIGAQRLNSSLSGSLAPLRVNSDPTGNQEKPKISMFADGGAAIVWQAGLPGRQDVFLRILRPDGTFVAPEARVNQFTTEFQINPAVTVLADGGILVAWDSYGQDGHLRAVMARRYDPDGTPLGNEFQVNQAVHLNQRNPAVTALDDGGFAVAWVSERLLGQDSRGGAQFAADILVRKFAANGTPVTSEIRVNSTDNLCASPAIVTSDANGFLVAWAESSTTDRESGWNILAAGFSAEGSKLAAESRINAEVYGDQFAPQLARKGAAIFAVWASLGQDGSYEGVFGRSVGREGQPFGSELGLNTLTYNRQLHPAVGVDSNGRFLVVWCHYNHGGSGFDLHGQRLASSAPLPVLPAPFATALSSTKVAISWPELAGYDVVQYEVHVDDEPVRITAEQSVTLSSLLPASSHSVRIGYRLSDGRGGELSPLVNVKTWAEDENFDGLPDDWQQLHWGDSAWPATTEDSDDDGASNLAEFLAGTNPTDAGDVLTLSIENRGGSIAIGWRSRPGLIYEVQRAADVGTWQQYGTRRFAADIADQIVVSKDNAGLFRVVRVR